MVRHFYAIPNSVVGNTSAFHADAPGLIPDE